MVASYRKMGNSELLAREALLEAKSLGADVALMRLTDLRVEPCKGCMACLFKGEECRIDDDVDFFLRELLKSDGVILASPTYILSPPGIVKMLLDRMIVLQHTQKIKELSKRRRVGAVMAVATNPEKWAPLTIPLLKTFLYTAQIRVVDAMIAEAAGPGEVLLDEETMKRARSLGAAVVKALEGQEVDRGETIGCPICHSSLIRLLGGNLVECPLCGIEGKLRLVDGEVRVEFPPEQLEKCRWTTAMAVRHTVEEILPTAKRYLENLQKIRSRMARYKKEDIAVVKPERQPKATENGGS